MGRRRRSGGGTSGSIFVSLLFSRKKSSLDVKASPPPKGRFFSSRAKGDKDGKASPPPKAETPHVESRPGRFFPSLAEGFDWGVGNAMGHRFVEAIFGPRTIKTEIALPEKVEVATVSATEDNDKYKDYTESCSISYNAFQECLNVEGNNLSKCHLFMDSLFECRKNSNSFNF